MTARSLAAFFRWRILTRVRTEGIMRTVVVTGGPRHWPGRRRPFAKGGDKVYFTYHANEEAAETTTPTGPAPRCPQSDAEAIAAAVDRIVGDRPSTSGQQRRGLAASIW
jgi:hypothetical protein